MELSGRIIAVMEAKSGTSSKTGNPWMMQGYVIEVPGQYPRRCAFTVFGEDRIKQLNIQNGEDLTVYFDIDAREYNGRWYNDFRAYAVNREGQIPPVTQPLVKYTEAEEPPFPPFGENKIDDGGDLPF
jgi:hypothetical protein